MHGQLKSSQSGIKIKLIHQYLFALAKKIWSRFSELFAYSFCGAATTAYAYY